MPTEAEKLDALEAARAEAERKQEEFKNWLRGLSPKKRKVVLRRMERRSEHRRGQKALALAAVGGYRCTCHKLYATPGERAACRAAHPKQLRGAG